jgi:diguanylate cyclase (GGDEF)-like protein
MASGLELTAMRADGSELAVDISLSPVHAGGETWTSAVMRDATDRTTAEGTLQAANDELTAMLTELEHRGRELALVNDMGEILQSCVTLAEAYTVIANFAGRLFPGGIGALFVPNDRHRDFTRVVAWGPSDSRWVGSFSSESCWALRRGQVHRSVDGIACHHSAATGPGAESERTTCLPLIAHGVVVGLVHICDGAPESERADDDVRRSADVLERVAPIVAEHLALALANLRQRVTLQARSIHDRLTGLYNRGHLDDSVEAAIRTASEAGEPVSVVTLDVDDFKAYNDSQGHAAGDNILRHVAAVLVQSVRPGDSVFRQGGDEFLVLLPRVTADVAAKRAVAFRNAMRNGEHDLTVSSGVAAFPTHGSSATELLEAADEALYRAKRAGRGRVELAPDAEPLVDLGIPLDNGMAVDDRGAAPSITPAATTVAEPTP